MKFGCYYLQFNLRNYSDENIIYIFITNDHYLLWQKIQDKKNMKKH